MEKSKFYRPTLHKPCIIQFQELMYDACYYHQTCVANNSCLELLKDILLTLSPAELDWVKFLKFNGNDHSSIQDSL